MAVEPEPSYFAAVTLSNVWNSQHCVYPQLPVFETTFSTHDKGFTLKMLNA